MSVEERFEQSLDTIFRDWLDQEIEGIEIPTCSDSANLASVPLADSTPAITEGVSQHPKVSKRRELSDWPSTLCILKELRFDLHHKDPFVQLGCSGAADMPPPTVEKLDQRADMFLVFTEDTRIMKWHDAQDRQSAMDAKKQTQQSREQCKQIMPQMVRQLRKQMCVQIAPFAEPSPDLFAYIYKLHVRSSLDFISVHLSKLTHTNMANFPQALDVQPIVTYMRHGTGGLRPSAMYLAAIRMAH